MLELRHRHARCNGGAVNQALTLKIAALLTLPPLLWAGNAVVGRMAVGTVPPLALNFARWLLAFVILLPVARAVLQDRAAIARRWKYLALVGLLGMGSYNAAQYLALQTSTPINVTLIAASSPVWMIAVGALFYGEHPKARQWLGCALSLAGVLLVLARGDATVLTQWRLLPGDLLMLAAIISWAFYSWLLARPPAHMRGDQRPLWNWAEFLLVQMAFGLAWSGAAAAGEWAVADFTLHWTPWLVPLLLYVAIGPSLIAYRCWGIGVATVGPAVAAFFGNLTPLFAALFSAALLGDTPRPFHAAAFVLIAAGIVVSARR
jgi:drug/metabolite transporter (DMT)-like permease